MQLTTYALAEKIIDGVMPGLVGLNVLVRTPKRHDMKLVQLESKRTQEHFDPLLARLERFSRVLESGMFTPAPPSAWWCAKSYCAYWQKCPYASRPVTVDVALEKGNERHGT
jgi:hypothetical protein